MIAMRLDEVARVNRDGWDRRVQEQDVWTRPVSSGQVDRARLGDWSVVLTPNRPVPRDWFGDVVGRDILCLASGGGQQGPVLAAAGARDRGELVVRFPLPYADVADLPPEELRRLVERDHTVEFSHTLETQIGGQLRAGFVLTHLFEDRDLGMPDTGPSRYFPTCLATRAVKLDVGQAAGAERP